MRGDKGGNGLRGAPRGDGHRALRNASAALLHAPPRLAGPPRGAARPSSVGVLTSLTFRKAFLPC